MTAEGIERTSLLWGRGKPAAPSGLDRQLNASVARNSRGQKLDFTSEKIYVNISSSVS